MCGISGLAFTNGNRTKEDYVKIRKFLKNLIRKTSARGKDATGMTIINKNEIITRKQPTSAYWFTTNRQFNRLMNKINNNTLFVLCHNRLATKGKISNSYNNHPILTGDVIGVHNGVISNDDELFKQHKLKRKGQVDSEIIFSLIDHYIAEKKTTPITKALKELAGMLAIAFVNLRKPKNLYLATNGSYSVPINYAKSTLGFYVFSSCREYIEEANRIGFIIKESLPLGEIKKLETDTMITINIVDDKITEQDIETKAYRTTYRKKHYSSGWDEYDYRGFDYQDVPIYQRPMSRMKYIGKGAFKLKNALDDSEFCHNITAYLRAVFQAYDSDISVYGYGKYLFISSEFERLGFAKLKTPYTYYYVMRKQKSDVHSLIKIMVEIFVKEFDMDRQQVTEQLSNGRITMAETGYLPDSLYEQET